MVKRQVFNLLLAVSVSLAVTSPTIAASSAQSDEKAHSLYEAGKFDQAEAAYSSLIEPSSKALQSKVQELARQLLGLARAQAAAGKWSAAEDSFTKSLGLAEGSAMPRSFIDEARAGFVEAQVKLGHPSSQQPRALMPLPLSRTGSNAAGPSRMSTFVRTTVPQRDYGEDEYLHKCAINYAEQMYGSNSSNAAMAYVEMASFYCRNDKISNGGEYIDKAAATFSALKKDEQQALAATYLDAATQMSDSDKVLQATMLTQPVIKNASAEWTNTTDLSSRLSRLADSLQRKRNFSQAELFEKQAVSLLEKASTADDANLASERLKLAGLLDNEGKYSSAVELYELAIPPTEAASGSNAVVKPYISLAEEYLKIGNAPRAKETVQKLTKVLGTLHSDQQDRSWTTNVMSLACSIARSGDLALTHQLYTSALSAAYNRITQNGWEYQINQGVHQLANQLENLNETKEAETLYLTVLDDRRINGAESDACGESYADLAQFYINHDQFDKAKVAATNLASIVKRYGRASRGYYKLGELARALQQKNRNQEAAEITQAAIDINGDSPSDLRDVVDHYTRLAACEDALGDHIKCQAALDRASALVAARMPKNLADVTPQFTQVVHKEMENGKLASASQLVLDIATNIGWQRQDTNTNSYYRLNLMTRLGSAFAQQQMIPQADACFKQAMEVQSKQHGPSSIDVANVLNQYANALRQAGKELEATELDNQFRVLNDNYQRQMRGETGAYKPFLPLSETMRNARLHNLQPDSST